MTKSDYSSFWTTGIWVMLRYLALPILIICMFYFFGGPTNRTKINARAFAFVEPVVVLYARLIGDSDLAQARIHVRDPDLNGLAVVNLDELPVTAEIPVLHLGDLPESDGPGHVMMADLPEPEEDMVFFLLTKPGVPLAVPFSPRPRKRPESTIQAGRLPYSQ